jgi:protoporphyrinogen oxidase
MKRPEEEITETFISGLTKMLPLFQRGDVIWSKLSRDMYTTPIFSRNYGMLLEEIENHSVSNLFFAGNYATYPLSRNVSEVVSSSFEIAQKIVGSIQAEKTRKRKE